jgi:TorA maturation chaperone TorD
MNTNDTPGDDVARAKIYKSLAECYYLPGEATRRNARLLGRSLPAICHPAAEAVERMEAAMLSDEGLEDLAIDHARLFVGPFALLAPPYGSVYLEGERRLMGDSTLAVSACYQEVGLEVAAGFNETPDHISAELEFMHFLVVRELEALAGGDRDRARYFRQKQSSFLESHLAAWIPVFTRAVEEQAQTRFYQDLAAATRLFVESDFNRRRGDARAVFSDSASA